MAEEILQPHERERFYFRLGKNRRDRRLATFITRDREQGVNVSKLVKHLLLNYYTGAPLPQHSAQQQLENDEETRQSALSAKLKGLRFDTLKQN